MQPKRKIDYDWLIESLSFYQNLGFFDQWTQVSIEQIAVELAAELDDRYRQGLAQETNLFEKYVDLMLLANDRSRVWWDDTEADVAPGAEVYRKTIREWAGISRDIFLPIDVHETWITEAGPVYITFALFGQPVKIRANYYSDYIDTGILKSINKLLVDTDFQFKMYEVFDQTAFVIMLKTDEIGLLKTVRGWSFQPGI